MHQPLVKRCSTSPLKKIVTRASRTRSPILCRLGASIRPAKLKERSTAAEDKGNHKNGSTAAGNSPPRWDQKVLISLQHCTLAFSIRVYLPHSSCSCLLRFILDSRRSSSSSSEIGTANNVHHIISSPLAMKSSGNCRAGQCVESAAPLPYSGCCTVGLWVIRHNEKEHRQRGLTRKWRVLSSAGLDLVLITYREHSVS